MGIGMGMGRMGDVVGVRGRKEEDSEAVFLGHSAVVNGHAVTCPVASLLEGGSGRMEEDGGRKYGVMGAKAC